MFHGLLPACGLATASGLNAYLPLLTLGLLARWTNLVRLAPPYDLLSHPAVLLLIAALAVLDFVADKVPGVDHALHVAGLIVHPVAGALVALAGSSSAGGVHPALAAACGVILAGGTHGARAAARPVATATTAGLANPVISFLEDVAALTLAVLAVLLPLLALALVVLVLAWAVRRILRFFRPPGQPRAVSPRRPANADGDRAGAG
jgi:hypothetical protein